VLVRLLVIVVIALMTYDAGASWHFADASPAYAEIDSVPEAEGVEEVALPGHVVCSGPVPDVVLDQPRAERAVPSIDGARVFRPPRVFGSNA
jgi:hypothetical protein